jgi:CubicO group peptidase (beta-lactamase class C family)
VIAQVDGVEQRRTFVKAQFFADFNLPNIKPEERARLLRSAEDIYPHRTVRPGNNLWKLKRSPKAKNFSAPYVIKGKTFDVADFFQRTLSSGLLILKNDQIVYERYMPGASKGTTFYSFSVEKGFKSILVGMAVDDRYIKSVNDRLTDYVPFLRGSAYDGVTIKNALQMLAGIDFDEDGKVHYETMAEQRYRFVDAAPALKRTSLIGKKFTYSTMNSMLLGLVVENATCKRQATYMEERFWKPAGMESHASWFLDGPPEIGREVSLGATLRDYGRFGLVLCHGGMVHGKRLVSSEWIKAATTPDSPAIDFGNLGEIDRKDAFGYFFWLLGNGRFATLGVYGQLIIVVPDQNLVMVKLSYWPQEFSQEMWNESRVFLDSAIQALEP